MPVYILHGFRWPRSGFNGIRVYIIVNNLDDAAAEYIQTPHSRAAILDSLKVTHASMMAELPTDNLTFIEQYDPEDVTSDAAVSQPYAYFADKVVTMALPGERPQETRTAEGAVAEGSAPSRGPHDLSINVEDVISEGAGLSAKGWDAFADLRDKLAPGEKIGWWIVYNGDPDRNFDTFTDDEDYDEEYEEEEAEQDIDEETTPTESKPPTPLVLTPNQSTELPIRTTSQENTTEAIRRKAVPAPKSRSTPFEDQKSPLKETPPTPSVSRDSATPTPEKRLPPVSTSLFRAPNSSC